MTAGEPLEITGLVKRFGAGPAALGPISLRAEAGALTVLIGRSGCGKTTLLRCVGGLETPDRGTIRLGGAAIDLRSIGYVFQEPRLMPWLTTARNVGFGLRALPRSERGAAVREALAVIGLQDAADRLPKALSGGMAQRVALARALATRPSLLLMDEPFSALDQPTRERLQAHLLDICRHYRPTVLLITHDLDEAIALADRIVVLRGPPGRVAAELTPGLARPRLRSDPGFSALRRRLEDTLGETRMDRAS